ncbi:MAG: hypothetical protein ACI841_005260, partial [Planctomycetota bacterium]
GGTDRLVRVLGSHSANPWTGRQIMGYQDAWQHADSIGIAPYFGGTLGAGTQATTTVTWNVGQVLDACEDHVDTTLGHIAENVTNAAVHGLSVTAYEGGQHLVGVGSWITNSTLQELFRDANRHSRMGELYDRYLAGWEALGGDTFCAFSSCVTPSLFGHWGALEWQDQPIEDAPKYRALRNALWRSSGVTPRINCHSRPNSLGVETELSWTGTTSILMQDLRLQVSDAVGNYGVFFFGHQLQPAPFGDGVMCIAAPAVRLDTSSITGGQARLFAGSDELPVTLQAGSSLHFQFWYRDPAVVGGTGYNLSNSLSVSYAP